MKICVDENIPLISVVWLKDSGHYVLDIRGTAEQGLTDELLWEKAQRENRLLCHLLKISRTRLPVIF